MPLTVNTSISSASAILLVGHPNVGKSVLFHRLTGAYVNVSNYPGTTVEVTRASTRFDHTAMLLDTPASSPCPRAATMSGPPCGRCSTKTRAAWSRSAMPRTCAAP
nr:FeoB small GTPase domain-containing protein [Dechloromonas sp. A34]